MRSRGSFFKILNPGRPGCAAGDSEAIVAFASTSPDQGKHCCNSCQVAHLMATLGI